MKKKILSAFLALCLALGSAAALPESVVTESTSITASAATTATSGKCGKNVSWTLKNGVLTISGKGDMCNYDIAINPSPFSLDAQINKVIINEGVESIGRNSFYGNSTITSIVLPKSLKNIGGGAFWGCSNLSEISGGSQICNVGNLAFRDTKWLENKKKDKLVVLGKALVDASKCSGNVSISSGIVGIGSSAFSCNNKVTSITLSNSVAIIGEDAFSGCTSLKSINLSSGVSSIGDAAFDGCKNLESITIPSSVKSIGRYVFNECSNLKSISIPSSISAIGDGWFYGCTSLKSITIPNSVTSIGNDTFEGCKSLTSVTIPNSVTSIGSFAFINCKSLKSFEIPKSVKSIDTFAFDSCTSLKSVTIPSSVTSIGEHAFGYYSANDTFSGKKVSGFTICGFKGSAAEKYAKKNGFKFVARSTTQPKTVRYAGSDRAETATKISKAVNAKTSDTVIIATGFDFHDALAAVPLASAYNAPLLLADRDNLSDKTINEIKRLKAKNVIVVASANAKDQNGNSAAIGKNVYDQLKKLKVKWTKLDGKTYYETAKKVAVQLKTVTKKNPTSLFITTDKNYADALSASPVAAVLGAPILYVDPKASLNATTKNYLTSIKKSVKNVYIVGGVNAVSKNVEKSVLSVLGKKSATRFAGDDRYETCVLINKSFSKNLTGKSVCIAKGYNFPDALAGGVFAAKVKAPLFLADKLGEKATISKTQSTYLSSKNPNKLYIFGGEAAVPTAIVKTIAKASI